MYIPDGCTLHVTSSSLYTFVIFFCPLSYTLVLLSLTICFLSFYLLHFNFLWVFSLFFFLLFFFQLFTSLCCFISVDLFSCFNLPSLPPCLSFPFILSPFLFLSSPHFVFFALFSPVSRFIMWYIYHPLPLVSSLHFFPLLFPRFPLISPFSDCSLFFFPSISASG